MGSYSENSRRGIRRDPAHVKNNKKRKSKRAMLFVCVALLLVFNIVFAAYYSIFNKITRISMDDVIPDDIDSIVLEDEDGVEGEDSFNDSINDSVESSDKLRSEDGVTNVLLLGTDGRYKKVKASRSDAIILLTINDNTKQIVLTSIMRDIYVDIPGRTEHDKINAAHAYGGPSLTIKTVENAFGVKIDHFAEVNFYAFMDIVDALGGVTVDVSSGEQEWLNTYVRQINEKQDLPADYQTLPYHGNGLKLNGRQALGYVRIRYVGHGDYERTERQRDVLTQLIEKVRSADYSSMVDVANTIAGNLITDYSELEMVKLAANANKYLSYDIVSHRIPAEGTYEGGIYHGKWILQIDFEANRRELHSVVFGGNS